MSARRLRLLLLVTALGASVFILVRAPANEPIDIAAHWQRIAVGTDGPCAQAAEIPACTRWELLAAPEAPATAELLGATALGLGPCPPGEAARGVLELSEAWPLRADFFGGYSEAHVGLDIRHTHAGCTRTGRWRLVATIDQGRRGNPRVAERHVGRIVGTFVSERFSAR